MKATEQYFPVVLFIMLYKVVIILESLDEILKCDHSNESYGTVLSCATVYYAAQGNSHLNLLVNYLSVTFQAKATEKCFSMVLFTRRPV